MPLLAPAVSDVRNYRNTSPGTVSPRPIHRTRVARTGLKRLVASAVYLRIGRAPLAGIRPALRFRLAREVVMKRSIVLRGLGALIASLLLAGCVADGYTYGVGMSWSSYPYSGWYDGYYGPFYDGYWGTDNYFYYRLHEHDRDYRRGDRNHFFRGEVVPNPRFHRFDGNTRQPPQGTRMPNYPRQDRDSDRNSKGGHRDDRRDNRR